MEIPNSDGVNGDFYRFLWVKTRLTGNYPFSLPHTLIYEDGAIEAWLFTNVQGKIVKKSSKKLQDDNEILKFFSKKQKQSRSKIMAKYMVSSNEGFKNSARIGIDNLRRGIVKNAGTVFHYFDFDALRNFFEVIIRKVSEKPTGVWPGSLAGVLGPIFDQ